MSRGHGRVQRAILVELATHPAPAVIPRMSCMRTDSDAPSWWGRWMSTYDLAGGVYATHSLTAAQVESVRRAVHRLTAQGLIEASIRAPYTVRSYNGMTWSATGGHWMLHVRLPLTAAERAADERGRAERAVAGRALMAMLR